MKPASSITTSPSAARALPRSARYARACPARRRLASLGGRARSTALFTAVAFLAACKGETKYKDSDETLAALDLCKKQRDDQKTLNDQYAARITELEAKSGQPGDVVVTIEGDALTVKPRTGGGGGGAPPVDDATAAALSREFLDQVEKSRGAIQKCYEQALKKNTGLQSRTVTIKLSASFAQTGNFQRTSFNPSLGDTFDNCLRTVAGRWKLKPAPASMTFQAQVSLVPA